MDSPIHEDQTEEDIRIETATAAFVVGATIGIVTAAALYAVLSYVLG